MEASMVRDADYRAVRRFANRVIDLAKADDVELIDFAVSLELLAAGMRKKMKEIGDRRLPNEPRAH
jgi:hypothetical protein